MTTPFLADADWFQILAAVIIFTITGIAQLLQKRAKPPGSRPSGDGDSEPAPEEVFDSAPTASSPPTVRPPVDRIDDWQEQIRRLLEGDPPPSTPPPVLPTDRAISPSSSSRRPSQPIPTESDSPDLEGAPSLEDNPAPSAPLIQWDERRSPRATSAARLAAASAAFTEASSLSRRIGDRFRQVDDRTSHHSPLPRSVAASRSKSRAHPHQRTGELLRKREGIRQAVVASIILQPPKSLES